MPEATATAASEPAASHRRAEKFDARACGVVAVAPDGPEAAALLAGLDARAGRHGEAVARLDEAIALDGSDPDYWLARAASRRALGLHGEAEEDLRAALRLRPAHRGALLELAALLAGSGRADEAEACAREAELAPPSPPGPRQGVEAPRPADPRRQASEALAAFEALRARAGGLLREGRYAEAVADYQQALLARPEEADLLNEVGIAYARLGRFREAAEHYRRATRVRPEFADAHNNLGNALRNQGLLDEAIASLGEAIRLRPGYPEAHNNLGICLRACGRHDEAIASYQRALDQRPDYHEAHNNMGFAMADRGRLEPAILCYRQALRLRPDYFEALHNLANALSDLGRHDEAVAAHLAALRLRPDDFRAVKNLGLAYLRQGKFAEAADRLREAIRLRPDFPEAHNDLGIALVRQDRFDAAMASYREAIRCRPDYAEAHNNLGNALRHLGRFAESEECYRRALQIRPDYADAHNNFGIALAEMGRFDEAVASYTECLRLHPNHVDAHMNRALTWLRKGDYAQGWAEYEWRWKKRVLTNRPMIQPAWNGFPLRGRSILLITEQGFGDTIQFARYGAVLKEQGATVILECPERLIPLLRHCPGIDHLIPQGQPLPHYDVYAPLMTVAPLVDTSIESVPNRCPYIDVEPELVAHWGRELAKYPGLKVGINWQGNPQYAGDYHRSIPLKHFEALARIPGVTLISLQQNHGMDQLAALGGAFPVVELGSRLDGDDRPFLDTAAVMKNLDLFVTSDTAVAHLAGALGVPTWMGLSTAPDWRWMTGREDCAWYPSMRIFRQSELMNWAPVFERLAAELRGLVPRDHPTRSVAVEVAPGELLDKITILEIKAARIGDSSKLTNIQAELAGLTDARHRTILESEALEGLVAELRSVNEALWDIEDAIREREHADDFGPEFVRLARAVYQTNDRRAELKRRINVLLGSAILEEKSYAAPG